MKAYLKNAPNQVERKAVSAAQEAADEIMGKYNATMHVLPEVVEAAKTAYRAAGGTREIDVIGIGNCTHPVTSVVVRIVKK